MSTRRRVGVRGQDDWLYVRDIRLLASIGAYAHEKKKKRSIGLELDMMVDAQKSAQTDRLVDTVDYAKVYRWVQQVVRRRHYILIETLANELAEGLLRAFVLSYVRVRLTKYDVPTPGAHVTIDVVRTSVK